MGEAGLAIVALGLVVAAFVLVVAIVYFNL
jgi:hypothetical protein